MPKMPDAARYWDVDQVIECLTIPGGFSKEVQSALMQAMPTAYGSRPFTETPPEPDANPEFKLARIWHKLDGRIQTFILAGFAKEGIL